MQNNPQTPRGGVPSGQGVRRTAPGPQSRPAQPSAYAPRPVQRSAPAAGQPRPTAGAQPARRTGPAPQSAQRPRQGAPAVRQAAPSPRPAASGPRPVSLNRAPSLVKPLIALALALAAGILLQFVLLPGGWVMAEKARATETVAEIASTRGVRINEVMTANKAACFDENGNCPDWIELYNASPNAVDITGWVLTDKTSRTIRFTFPRHVMDPGEYVIVFADGFLHNDENETWHAPFRLSAFGDTLMLFDEHGTVVQSMNIPEMGEDDAYAWRDGGWVVTNEYTPLLENTAYNYAQLTTTQILRDSDLIVTEVMASNKSYRSPSGVLSDWIEITNRGSEAIDLSGYALSDKPEKPARWRFPEIEIQPGEVIVVYASGLDRVMENGELHTSFSLSSERESVYLYTPARQILDAVSWENLKTDQSYVRQADGGWSVSTSPTPGSAN